MQYKMLFEKHKYYITKILILEMYIKIFVSFPWTNKDDACIIYLLLYVLSA